MTPVEIIKIVEQIASPYFQFNMEDFYGDKNTYEHPTMEAITTLFFKLNVKDGVATLTKEEEQQMVLYGNPNASLVIGNFCSIASGCTIYLGGNHRHDWVTTYPFGHVFNDIFTTYNGEGHPSTKGDVIIGNDVWIGGNVTIMSGVTIGDGAVIANNSHVVKNVEPYTLVGGNPAQFIKYRFEKEQIEKLMEIKWWDWEESRINQAAPLLCNTNIDGFIQFAELLVEGNALLKLQSETSNAQSVEDNTVKELSEDNSM